MTLFTCQRVAGNVSMLLCPRLGGASDAGDAGDAGGGYRGDLYPRRRLAASTPRCRGRKPADLLRRCGIVERLGAQLGRESNLHAQFVNDEVERAREASGEASEDGCP